MAGALADKLLKNSVVEKVTIDFNENDCVILPTLKNANLMIKKYKEQGKELLVNIIEENFILSNEHKWNDETFEGLYDIVIANPHRE